MTVQLAPPPVFQGFGPLGLPLVGGQLFTYIAGTTTPQVTYVDSTQTTPNTNPVILNSLGQANVWLVIGQTYKLVLNDANGNLIWSVDQIPGGVSQANIGAALWPVTADETAHAIVPTFFYYPPYDVRRYGAIGDGVTNDTAALTVAHKLNLVNYPGPAFNFVISQTIPISGSTVQVNGNNSTLIVSAAWVPVSSVMTNVSITSNDVTIQNLNINGAAYAGASSQNWGFVFQNGSARGRLLNSHFASMPPLGSAIAFFTGSTRHVARGNTFDTCHGAVFSQADHSIQDNNIALNPLDTSFVCQGTGNVGSSIINNKIYNPSGNPNNNIGIEEGPSDGICTGNYIYGLNGNGIYFFNSVITTSVRGWIVADNIIDGGNGTVSAPGQVVSGILMTPYYSDCDIHDNIVKNLPSNVSSSSSCALLYQTNSRVHDNEFDATSAPGLVGAVTFNATGAAAGSPTIGTLDYVNNRLINTGGNRGILLAAGAFGSFRLNITGGEIIGGSIGIDANFTVNSGADLWIVNMLRNTATTAVNFSTNYTALTDFQTYFNTGNAFAFPHSMKTLSPTVMFGTAIPGTAATGVNDSTVYNGAQAVAASLMWVKIAGAWRASLAVF